MTSWTRLVVALLVTTLLSAAVAPLAAAQQPATPPPAPSAPDLFQESLKAERAASSGAGVYHIGAAVTNVFLVPGRVFTCAAGGVIGVGVLAITLGTGYRAASSVWQEGCGGRWFVTGEDLRPDLGSTRNMESEQR